LPSKKSTRNQQEAEIEVKRAEMNKLAKELKEQKRPSPRDKIRKHERDELNAEVEAEKIEAYKRLQSKIHDLRSEKVMSSLTQRSVLQGTRASRSLRTRLKG
jgi:hypothetical protein